MTNADTPWAEALERARTGTSDEIGELLEPYRKYLKTLARAQYYRSRQIHLDPSDMVQETFLRACGAITQFRGSTERELMGWLRAILASRLADSVRKAQARVPIENLNQHIAGQLEQSSLQLHAATSRSVQSPSTVAAQRETVVRVAQAIEDLPEDYRTVILLHHIQGQTYAEVAELMERSVDSIKKLWVRALAKLQRHLEKDL